MDQYLAYIKALGQELGLEIQLSLAGAAHFAVDGHGLVIQWAEARRAIMVYAEIGSLSGWRDGEVAKTLMTANFLFLGSKGGALSLDPSCTMVGLNYQIPVADLTPDAFVKTIDGIVTEAEAWRTRLARISAEQEKLVAQAQSEIESQKTEPESNESFDMLNAMSMLRV